MALKKASINYGEGCNFPLQLKLFSQTLENDTVSSIGSKVSSTGSKGSGKSNGKREQATSVSFMNIPGPSAKSARSPVTTRSRAASKGKIKSL